MASASLVFGGDNPVENFTNLPFNSEGRLVWHSGKSCDNLRVAQLAFGPSNSV